MIDFHKLKIPKGEMPRRIKPMLATVVDMPFDDINFIFELKWDGYRAISEIENGKVELYSRNLNSFTASYSPIVESLKKVKNNVVFDGEIVALDENGRSRFQLLQDYKMNPKILLAYYIFDILYLDGFILKDLPLSLRKEILKEIFPDFPGLKLSTEIPKNGKKFYEFAKEQGFEGIIAKNLQSKYYFGKRSSDWQKIKILNQQEAVICGYTPPGGARKYFGALILGIYENNKLIHIGQVGTGFDDQKLKDLFNIMQPLKSEKSPFEAPPKIKATWIKPTLVCQIKFNEWTNEGTLRQPVFLGLREDKEPNEVRRE